jgi:antitoxin MazE
MYILNTVMASEARVQLVKWGNSHAVRLPKKVLQQAKIREGDELNVHVESGRISLEPSRPRRSLDQLVAAISPGNIHHEIDWGRPVGKEIW